MPTTGVFNLRRAKRRGEVGFPHSAQPKDLRVAERPSGKSPKDNESEARRARNHRSYMLQNIGPERTDFGAYRLGAVGSPAATTLENNEKFAEPPDERRTGCVGRLAEERGFELEVNRSPTCQGPTRPVEPPDPVQLAMRDQGSRRPSSPRPTRQLAHRDSPITRSSPSRRALPPARSGRRLAPSSPPPGRRSAQRCGAWRASGCRPRPARSLR